MKVLSFILWLLCFINFSYAQYHFAPIDTVFLFIPGKGQNTGQDSSYFPKNIFNLPRETVSELLPESSPEYICSLGLGGEIIVGWKNYVLIDAEGDDFTIFENAFINPITKKIFVEPAIVSVSYDGLNFVTFPYDFRTLQGCAGTKPTNGSANPFDPSASGGNSFDLSSVGLSKIRYIKIKDISDSLLADTSHPYYDPIISGFDLDCVVGLHLVYPQTSGVNIPPSKVKILRFANKITFDYNIGNCFFQMFDALGNKLESMGICNSFEIDLSQLNNGIYFIVINYKDEIYVFKVVKWYEELFICD